jgi:hypothetical protein
MQHFQARAAPFRQPGNFRFIALGKDSVNIKNQRLALG